MSSSEEACELKEPRKRITTRRSLAELKKKMAKKTTQKNVLSEEIKVEPLFHDFIDFDPDEEDEEKYDEENENKAKTTGVSKDPLLIKQEKIFAEAFSGGNTKQRRAAKRAERAYKRLNKPPRGKRIRKPRANVCPSNCQYECNSHFDSAQRNILCSEFWAMNSEERLEFFKNSIEKRQIKRIRLKKTERPRRGFSCRYHLRSANGEQRRVCTFFFMSTLSLNCTRVNKMLKKMREKTTEENEIEPTAANTSENAESTANTTTSISAPTTAPKPPPIKPIQTNKGKKLDLSRKLRPANCEEVNCRFHCPTKMSEEQRVSIHKAFWALDFKRRKDFLINHVETHAVTTKVADVYRKTDRPRSCQNHYFLRNEKGENVRVCSRFFLATLSLSSNYIRDTLRRSDPNTGTYIGGDLRGRKEPHNKTKPELREDVKRHIESYSTWSPNKRSKTRYLHSSLSIKKMFEEYKQKCIEESRKFVNCSYFRKVFRDDFRLAFLRPSFVSSQKVGTTKRNAERLEDPTKEKRFRLPNPYLSDYTGEEGGFWSTGANVVELSTPVKEVTVTTTYEPQQNVVFATQPSAPATFIRYTNFPQQQTLTQIQRVQNIPPMQQIQQQIQVPLTSQQVTTSSLIGVHYDDQTPTVFRML